MAKNVLQTTQWFPSNHLPLGFLRSAPSGLARQLYLVSVLTLNLAPGRSSGALQDVAPVHSKT